jgi:DNA-binding transcriptional MerR regulator
MGTASLQIGRVAQKTGLSVDAIRFYEKSGLLPRGRTQRWCSGAMTQEAVRTP